MQRVAVIGVASSTFGDHRTTTTRALGAETVQGAMEDAGISADAIDTAYVGCALTGVLDGQESMVGQIVLRELGITGIPITRVENACSSSACAVREASIAINAGESDIALAFGIEKMLGYSTNRVMDVLTGDGDVALEGNAGLTFPGIFAMAAREHMSLFGTPREAMAAVAEKAHKNAMNNADAHFRRAITREEALRASMVSDPLTIYDCCPISDGAAAVILASEEVANNWQGRVVWLDACVLATGEYEFSDLSRFSATERASKIAYKRSGYLPGDIDVAEVHDCFTIAEIIHSEDLGFFEKGDGGFAVLRGDTQIGGAKPINVSGGLKAKGHPVGATGAGQIVEITKQLRGELKNRQIKDANVGLCHCMGGFFGGDTGSVVVSILSS